MLIVILCHIEIVMTHLFLNNQWHEMVFMRFIFCLYLGSVAHSVFCRL